MELIVNSNYNGDDVFKDSLKLANILRLRLNVFLLKIVFLKISLKLGKILRLRFREWMFDE